MNITVRIPTEQYAYIELHFDNLDEYKTMYPEVARVIKETRQKVNQKHLPDEPF